MLSERFDRLKIATTAGNIPLVGSKWSFADYWGAIRVRSNVGRNKYRVIPGLYALNSPDHDSPVFISANYKLSFDHLRRALGAIRAWILVLDTKGINVWCAAGKGTFGTEELIKQITDSRLHEIVKHPKIIVPQLGAPGIAAHTIKDATGFLVLYGPVRATDIPAYLSAGNKATDEMRRVHFTMRDRLILTPVELTQALKYVVGVALLMFLLSGFHSMAFSSHRMIHDGLPVVLLVFSGYLSGAFFTPVLLPFIFGRAFSTKGFWMMVPIFLILFGWIPGLTAFSLIEKLAWFLMMAAISSFLAMNFTGASTYTSLSGVKKEMKYAVPLQITGMASGLLIWLVARIIG